MSDKELYIFLDLNGKLDHNFFQKENIYFKMVNINTDNPLVQVGNFVFQGHYEDFLGTKVFFIEDNNYEPCDNVFIKESPIHLKYIAKTVKVMQLKWRKLPTNVVRIDNNECVDLKFTESYNAILEKFEKGALDMQDIIYDYSKDKPGEPTSETENKDDKEMEVDEQLSIKDTTMKVENIGKSMKNTSGLVKYTLLKNLAQMPIKQREKQKLYPINKERLAKAENADNFPVLSQLFLQGVTFKSDKSMLDECDFNKYVDINKSIEDGIIVKVGDEGLTTEQKASLLNVNNFDNFTLPMKLAYLTEQLEEYKRIRQTKNAAELRDVDEYGRNFKERYRMLKMLTKQMWFIVYSNCSDYA